MPCEMVKLDECATTEFIEILLSLLWIKYVTQCIIPGTCRQDQVILLHKRDDKLKIEICLPIGLLLHLSKLLTKIIKNRFTNNLDDCQPPEKAGFRKCFITKKHIQLIRSLINRHVALVAFEMVLGRTCCYKNAWRWTKLR